MVRPAWRRGAGGAARGSIPTTTLHLFHPPLPLAVMTTAASPAPAAGKAGARLKDDDSLDEVVYVNDHDHLLFFTTEVGFEGWGGGVCSMG